MCKNDKKAKIELCNKDLEASKHHLSQEIYSEIHNYINTDNEWGLGIETLIDALTEEDIKIEKEQINKIRLAMASMGLGQNDRVEILMTG